MQKAPNKGKLIRVIFFLPTNRHVIHQPFGEMMVIYTRIMYEMLTGTAGCRCSLLLTYYYFAVEVGGFIKKMIDRLDIQVKKDLKETKTCKMMKKFVRMNDTFSFGCDGY